MSRPRSDERRNAILAAATRVITSLGLGTATAAHSDFAGAPFLLGQPFDQVVAVATFLPVPEHTVALGVDDAADVRVADCETLSAPLRRIRIFELRRWPSTAPDLTRQSWPDPPDRRCPSLERALVGFGAQLLRETTDVTVVAVFRLAIAEAVRASEVAGALDSSGRQTSRFALTAIMAEAASHGLLSESPAEMAEQFEGLLWGDLMISLLLGSVDTPSPPEVARRARTAVTVFLQLHPDPGDRFGGARRSE
jgi:AefR-like transcriptional repressor, C-terminal domain